MTTPLVSVIISCYNHREYVADAITSVLEQTYPNLELLVYDDGSTDGSADIIRALAERHGFFFQAHANLGLARTLNLGVERAKGSLIAPFGSDDIMMPERFTVQVPWMLGNPRVGLGAGNIIKIDQHGKPFPAKKQRHYPEHFLDFNDIFLGHKRNPPTATFLFRREALMATGGFNPDIRLEDLYVELKLLEAGWQIGMMDATLSKYRLHPTNNVKNLRMMHEAVLKTYGHFRHHPDYEKACHLWINHQLLKASDRDLEFARECLAQLPWRARDLRTLKAMLRMWKNYVS